MLAPLQYMYIAKHLGVLKSIVCPRNVVEWKFKGAGNNNKKK